jgi:hypothetical protein
MLFQGVLITVSGRIQNPEYPEFIHVHPSTSSGRTEIKLLTTNSGTNGNQSAEHVSLSNNKHGKNG